MIQKKLLALLLVLTLLMTLCACKKAETEATITEPEISEELAEESIEAQEETAAQEPETEPEQEPTEAEGLWYDALNEQGTYQDELGTIKSYSYVLPALRAEGTEAEALNAQILEDCAEALEDLRAAVEENRDPMYDSVFYNAFRSGDTVSFLLTMDTGVNDVVVYRAYSFNTETGKILTGADLLTLNGYTEQDFCDAAIAAVSDYFEETWSAFAEDEFYTVQYRKSLSADAFGSFLPLFLNDEGELCFAATVYGLVGADSYEVIFRLFG